MLLSLVENIKESREEDFEACFFSEATFWDVLGCMAAYLSIFVL